MNRKRPRLSLSRRKKTKISEVEDMKSELCGRDGNSEIVVFPPDENPVIESKQNHAEAKDSQSNKKIKSLGKTKEKTGVNCMDNNNGNPANKRIATWFLKPCSPKSVSCPLCGKLAILSKINQHLDSNCKLHLALLIAEDCTTNELAGAHSCSPCSSDYSAKEVLKPSYQNARKDRRENRSECYKPCVKSPESRDENLALEGVSSILKPANERNDFILLKKMSQKMDSKKQSPFAMDEESCIESSSDCDQGTACQEPCDTFATLSREGKSIHNDGNDPNEVQASNINLTEDVSENSKEKEDKDHEPYYLANFKLVVNNVLSNKDDRQLFNEEDNGIIDAFNVMSSEEQKLYIRLFQRKHGWFRCSKLEYLRISNNLTPILKSLAEKGFLEDESHLRDLREALNLSAAPDLKLLVKTLHISSKSVGQKGGTKEDTIEMIVNHAENQKTLFGSFRAVVLKRVKQALGCCVRLAAYPKDVFSRLLLLFTMNVIPDDEDSSNNGQAQQLSTLYLANIGKVVYPAYVIDRPTPVFHSRDSLIQFSEAYQHKYEMLVALENKNFEQAYIYYPDASKKFDDILAKLKNCSEISTALLPGHLRCFTAEWAITKMCYYGVEVLQKWRKYDEAVNQLESLLQQDIFCFDSRGRWYDRLALNLHQHLKQPEKAMQVIREALLDPHVRFGRRLALIQRAKRILSSPAFTKGKKRKCEDYGNLELIEPDSSKSITISGTRCAELGVFIAPEIDQDGQVIDGTTTFCAVEEYALSYYRQKGFDQGIHGEGSTFSSLYILYMWDIIFASGIPDVFRSPFQAAPLDFCYDAFYESRKQIIDKRLEEISITSVEKLQDILSKAWNDYEGQVCAGISWDRFTSVEQAKQLVACLGGQIMSGIFTRFAQGYRYCRAGMPDLVVWNSSTLDYVISEVKGPGDKLSTKQLIWLDVLQSLGANVEVCYVTDVGAKRLKVSK